MGFPTFHDRWRRLRGASTAPLDAQTALRLKSTASAGIDYILYILILLGFAYLGSIRYSVVLELFVVAAALNIVFIGSQWSGLTRLLKDPSITWAQVGAACGINLLGMTLAPQIAPVYIVNLFIPLCYGGLYFTRREFLAVWVLLSFALGIVILSLNMKAADFSVLHWSTPELFLLWIAITLALGRFLAINAEVSRLRERLHRKNKALTAATTQLAELASHDELTGLLNRREFMRMLDAEYHRISRLESGCFSVAIIDADHFKRINDNFGHLVGDRVLREVARLLDSRRRASETLARYGGEEFTLLLVDCDDGAVSIVLERLRKLVEEHDWEQIAPGLTVTISAGGAIWRRGETATQLLNRADAALYEAKNAGRNRIRVA